MRRASVDAAVAESGAADLARQARLAGIRGSNVTFEAVEGRRAQLYVVVMAALAGLAGITTLLAFGNGTSDGPATVTQLPGFRFLPLALTVGLAFYIHEKERYLRRVTHLMLEDRAMMAELEREARRDPLTGLPNRAALHDRLAEAAHSGDGRPVGLMFIDLDKFKIINDDHGHEAGDAVLEHVATRLRRALRRDDLVARIGGDEFALVASDVPTRGDLVMIAERIISELNEPILFGDLVLRAGASIGMAIGEPGRDPAQLLREADLAMYTVKSTEGRQWAFFDPEAEMADRQPVA